MARAIAVLCLCALPTQAAAQTLSVYGPEGTARERRVMAVLADDDGRCVPVSVPLEWSAAGGEVAPEEAAGDCVRWLRLTRDADDRFGGRSDVLRVRVAGPGLTASAVVPMRDAAHLEVRARRVGRRLIVEVEGVSREGLSGFVVADGETIPLEVGHEALEARVPGGLLGVVVRTGTMVGVTAVRPRGSARAAQVLVLASDLAIEGGGPPREVAFVVASDRHGRLSQELPLTVQSTRGELRSLRWVGPGVAAIGLSAPAASGTIDLAVGHEGEALTRVELDVASAWPVSAEIASMEVRGGFVVAASAVGADGEPVSDAQFRARCGASEPVALPAHCDVQPGEHTRVTVMAVVDGRLVPLAVRELTAREVESAVEPEPPPAARADWQVVAFARGGYDVWERAAVSGGGRVAYAPVPWLSVGVSLGYRHTFWRSSDASDQRRALLGQRASVEALVYSELAFGEDVGGVIRLALGGGWTGSRITLDGVDDVADVAHFTARLAGGPRFRFGAIVLGADVGVSTGVDSSVLAWERAPLAVHLEVNGGVSLP